VINGAPAKLSWEAEGLRFSAFPPPSVAFELKPLWETLVGKVPEEVQERPQQGLRNEFGPLLDDHFFVTQLFSRIDFILAVHPQKAFGLEVVSVGPYERAEKAHVELAKKWLKGAPSLGRIAYAPTLVHRVDSVEQGYKVLRELLPRLPLDEGAQSLLWQINRPRPSKVVNGVTINRLSKWSVTTQQRMQLLPETQIVFSGPVSTMSACKLELDIYTDPIEPLPAENLVPLLDELIATAKEISERGDIL
jgi:hypothetical protein